MGVAIYSVILCCEVKVDELKLTEDVGVRATCDSGQADQVSYCVAGAVEEVE